MRRVFNSFRAVASIAVVAVALGGCVSSVPAQSSQPNWEEPGWIAQARQQVEEYQTARMACLTELGVVGKAAPGGTVMIQLPTDESGLPLPGTEELLEQAQECQIRVPEPDNWDLEANRAAYDRMLDARECLIAHEYEVAEAPSFDVWREQSVPWNPHQVALEGRVWGADLSEIMSQCPQSGVGIWSVVDAEQS